MEYIGRIICIKKKSHIAFKRTLIGFWYVFLVYLFVFKKWICITINILASKIIKTHFCNEMTKNFCIFALANP